MHCNFKGIYVYLITMSSAFYRDGQNKFLWIVLSFKSIHPRCWLWVTYTHVAVASSHMSLKEQVTYSWAISQALVCLRTVTTIMTDHVLLSYITGSGLSTKGHYNNDRSRITELYHRQWSVYERSLQKWQVTYNWAISQALVCLRKVTTKMTGHVLLSYITGTGLSTKGHYNNDRSRITVLYYRH